MSLTKKINLPGLVLGLVLASLFVSGIALAQTTDIPPELVSLAQDLGCQNSAECAEKFDANIEQGITLAQKYDIYTPEQEKVAASFKTEVLERLRGISQDNFEEEILALANKILKEKPALAKTMSLTRQTVNAAETVINTIKDAGVDIRTCQKSPENLSREQLIACVKAGNNLSGKGTSVGDYIPKGNVKAEEVGRMLDLENSLLAGEYSGLGKINVEEAGQICLKSGSESISDCDRIAQKFFGNEGVKHLQEARQQTTRIKEYYTEGIERMELVTPDGQKLIGKGAIRNACDRAFEDSNLGLARACGNFAVKNGYATQAEIENGLKLLETFSQKSEGVNFDDCRFNPQSCREFLPDEFRSQFDSQFEIFKIMSESIGFDPARCENTYDPDIGKRCLEGAKKALSQVETIAQKSPEARRVVDEIRSHINEGERMTQKRDEFNQDSSRGGMAGPGGCRGPEECFKYCSQPTNSAECISFGAKSQIFDQNTVVQKFNMVNEQFNPPQGQPYPYPFQNNNTFPVGQNQNQYPQYPYPYQPQQPVGPSPECFAAISSGDFAKAKIVCSSTTENYPKPIAEPFPVCPAYAMPSPCPEGQMRQMASDAKGCMAYGACIVIEGYKPIDTPKPCPTNTYWNGTSCVANPMQDIKNTCPMMPTVDSCPAGQEKYQTYNSPECGIYYGCRIVSDKTNIQTSCASGQWWDPATQSCKSSPVPTVGSCNYSTQYWKASNSTCQSRTNCTDTANSEYNSSECQGVRGMTQPISSGCGSFTTQAMCQASPGCGWANGACGGNTTTSNTCPAGQYWYYPPSGGAGYCMTTSVTNCTSGQYWNGTACVASLTTSSSCPAGYHSHNESGGFCMNDQENYSGTCYNSSGTTKMACPQQTYTSPMGGCGTYMTQASCTTSSSGCSWQNNACSPTGTYASTCSSGQYWNGTACVNSSTTGQCPSGQYWFTPSGGGTGYCKTTSTTDCPTGQYWNGTTCAPNTSTNPMTCPTGQYWTGTACAVNPSTTTTTTCPSGQHWYTPSSGAGYCMSDTTSSTTCPSGQYWNGTSCVSSTTSGSSSCTSGQYWNGTACVANTSTSTTDPSASCAQTGGTWNGSSCQMPTTTSSSTTSTTSPSTTCSSGQYWNGSACVTSSPPPTSTSPPSSSDPATMCAQSGGTWTGSTCQMAKSISDQKDYYSYYQKQSGSALAQAIRAFTDLFK